jgi:iron complex transport system substrate-binding protein
MYKFTGIVAVLLLLVGVSDAVDAAAMVDDDGHTVLLPGPAARIVSLSPGATAMLFAAGAGAQIVGTAAFSDEPAAARAIARIGDSQGYDLERIVALRPDVIVAWGSGTNATALQRLSSTGIPVYSHHVARLADIPGALQRLGQLAGTQSIAAATSADFAARLAALRVRYATATRRSVLLQVWDQPVYTVGGTQLLSDAISYCGYRNAYADLKDAGPAVSVESVLARNPTVIIAIAPDAMQADEWLQRWRAMSALNAVRSRRLLAVVDQRFSRLGPSVVDATEALCTRLQNPGK